MDAHRVLRFDRFALDLTRGSLRSGEQDIDLPPKAFAVLRYLAENAGRLVPKHELLETIWRSIVVTDDSLAQCIRELREKLGDSEHRLIKTVPRRGYRLDTVVTETPSVPSIIEPTRTRREQSSTLSTIGATPVPYKIRLWGGVAVSLVLVALGVAFLFGQLPGSIVNSDGGGSAKPLAATPQLGPISKLFTERDAEQFAALADRKQLPVPTFQIHEPAHDVPDSIRRFVGIWISGTGWLSSKRQFMLIVTNVDKDGIAAGFSANGPAQPGSRFQSPAFVVPFKARISADSLSYSGDEGEHGATLTQQNRLAHKLTWWDGRVALVTLDPVWNLVEAERAAK